VEGGGEGALKSCALPFKQHFVFFVAASNTTQVQLDTSRFSKILLCRLAKLGIILRIFKLAIAQQPAHSSATLTFCHRLCFHCLHVDLMISIMLAILFAANSTCVSASKQPTHPSADMIFFAIVISIAALMISMMLVVVFGANMEDVSTTNKAMLSVFVGITQGKCVPSFAILVSTFQQDCGPKLSPVLSH
jgi:hypothetical protein